MRPIVHKIILFLLCAAVLPLFSATASALEGSEETTYYDCREDQAAYSAQVAELNRRLQTLPNAGGESSQSAKPGGAGPQSVKPGRKSGKSSQTPQYVAVLCRTEGGEMDFSRWAPSFVVGGPYDCYTLYFSSEAAAQALEELPATPGIRYAERDTEVNACGETEYEFSSWGAEAMNFGAYLSYSSAWGSGSATVAIVDSGVAPHPRLAGRIPESGYDYVDGDTDATNDLFGHGTNVAGIVADCSAGQPVYLYPIRVLNANGSGSISNVTNAVREATRKGVDVINLSLESSVLSTALDDAILDAVRMGVAVVCAAGNHAIDTAQVSPAHLSSRGVIVVGAAESDGSRANYSNYGASVDVYAYGTGIVCCSRSGGYVSATGTSMSAPHISGLAAMLRLIHHGIGAENIEQRIVSAADSAAAVNVPDLRAMIPERRGFCLTELWLESGEYFRLPVTALPETAMESISYQSGDDTVLEISGGLLIPLQEGTVTVTASCTGFADVSFEVEIRDSLVELTVPEGLISVEDGAFQGNAAAERVVLPDGLETLGDGVFENCGSLKSVTLPDSLLSLGENSFSGAVILCPEGSEGDRYAVENGLNYVLIEAA